MVTTKNVLRIIFCFVLTMFIITTVFDVTAFAKKPPKPTRTPPGDPTPTPTPDEMTNPAYVYGEKYKAGRDAAR